MSYKFNKNELIIISKYIEHDDYENYFKIFPNINELYHSTFNYINLNIYDYNYTYNYIIKHKSILNIFPNVKTIIINFNFKYTYYHNINLLKLIIKVFNLFNNLYKGKFIKIIINNEKLIFSYRTPKDKTIKYLDIINELIKNNQMSDNFKFYMLFESFNKYKFVKIMSSKILIDFWKFEKLHDCTIDDILSNEDFMVHSTIKNENDLNDLYTHLYINTIFKNLNNHEFYYCKNKLEYRYIKDIKYFPSYYKLMKLNIKLKCNKTIDIYIKEYIHNFEFDNIEKYKYVNEYLFGEYPLKIDIIKNYYNKYFSINSFNYNNVVKVLNDIFK